jgi:glycine dehydrogenase subunit 1
VLGADAPDPRAAHPPREGDVEHLHQPGAPGPPRQHLPRRDGPARAPRGRRAEHPQAHYAAEALGAVKGLRLAFPGPFFKEFAIRCEKDPAAVLAEVGRLGYHGGVRLGRWYPELDDCILVAVTEKRTKDEIDGLAAAYRRALETV